MKMVKGLKYKVQVVTTALYSESKILNHGDPNYIIVDIGKEYTDVGVVLGENIIQTRSFGIGGLFFSKELSSKMGFDIQTANGKKEAYSLQTLPEEEADRVGDHLYYSGKMWRSAFETVLTSMAGIKSFPEKIYITGGGSHLPVIQELLYEDEWRQAVPFASDISIEIPKSDSWKKYLHDELNVLAGPQMFVPVSIGIVQLELS